MQEPGGTQSREATPIGDETTDKQEEQDNPGRLQTMTNIETQVETGAHTMEKRMIVPKEKKKTT